MTKPSIAELLQASGYKTFSIDLVLLASQTLYGDVGANLDQRDWEKIMSSTNPLISAQLALKAQWQNTEYLLRNAGHLISHGYSALAAEFTYRQMAQRLDYSYDTVWSKGTTYESLSALTKEALDVLVAAETAATRVPQIYLELTSNSANLELSHAGRLSFSVAGSTENVNAGDVALTPGSLKEGFVTLTRDSGASNTTNSYIVVGTNAAMTRNFSSVSPSVDRLIILGSDNDTVFSGDGNDTVYGGDGADNIFSNQGNDLIRAGNGADFIQAGKGNDTVLGDAGEDSIYGGSEGSDQLVGGADADQFLIPNDGTWFDTITDFVSGTDDITVTNHTLELLKPLSAIGTQTVTSSAGPANSIEIVDNDVHYVSVNGQAGNLTTAGTSVLSTGDLTTSTLTNLAAYLDERFTNALDTGLTGAVDAIFVLNWSGSSNSNAYVYEFTENAVSANIVAAELKLLAVVELPSSALSAGDII